MLQTIPKPWLLTTPMHYCSCICGEVGQLCWSWLGLVGVFFGFRLELIKWLMVSWLLTDVGRPQLGQWRSSMCFALQYTSSGVLEHASTFPNCASFKFVTVPLTKASFISHSPLPTSPTHHGKQNNGPQQCPHFNPQTCEMLPYMTKETLHNFAQLYKFTQ